jgi:glycosyltransferase involved in cell wall biosynthesis
MLKHKKNIHIYPSTYEYEPRMFRLAEAINESSVFDEIIFIGISTETSVFGEFKKDNVTIDRIGTYFNLNYRNKLYRILRFFNWTINIFLKYKSKQLSCINCHSLSALPICLLLKFKTRAHLIYDAHELETETNTMRGIFKYFAKLLELYSIRYFDSVIVVSDSIARWYRDTYGIKVLHVIKNVPILRTVDKTQLNSVKFKLRNIFNIPENDLLYLHQGRLGDGRGLELILEAFADNRIKSHIVFIGFGPLVDLIKKYSTLHNNIHYHDPVPYEELGLLTKSADIGIHLIENTCLNHYYCLPNKIFEYAHADIPVLVSDFPELKNILNKFNFGWTVPVTLEALCKKIIYLSENRSLINKAKLNCSRATVELSWNLEREKLLKIYKNI